MVSGSFSFSFKQSLLFLSNLSLLGLCLGRMSSRSKSMVLDTEGISIALTKKEGPSFFMMEWLKNGWLLVRDIMGDWFTEECRFLTECEPRIDW